MGKNVKKFVSGKIVLVSHSVSSRDDVFGPTIPRLDNVIIEESGNEDVSIEYWYMRMWFSKLLSFLEYFPL